jgi:hypothetical protein
VGYLVLKRHKAWCPALTGGCSAGHDQLASVTCTCGMDHRALDTLQSAGFPRPVSLGPSSMPPAHRPVSRRGLTPLGPSTPEVHSTHATKQFSVVWPKCSCACVCQVNAVHAARHEVSQKKHGMCQHALLVRLSGQNAPAHVVG